MSSESPAIPVIQPKNRTWPKRLVFLGTAAVVMLGIFGATNNRLELLKRTEQIRSTFDATVLLLPIDSFSAMSIGSVDSYVYAAGIARATGGFTRTVNGMVISYTTPPWPNETVSPFRSAR